MKIVVFEVEQWERPAFDSLRDSHEVIFENRPLTASNIAQYTDAEIVSPFVYSNLGTEIIQQFSNLKLISTRSTGFDHIDQAYCAAQGIPVCNVPTYGDHTVAEHVFGLLLSISHTMVEAVDRTRRGDFSLRGLQGFDLRGKTLGVIGTGAIGRNVISIAKGFAMDIIAFDVRADPDLAARMGFRYMDMPELLAQSDIITLHVPYNQHTHHLLNDETFAQMKDGVVLINTARGAIVDVQALVRALATGKVQAAGLDVLPEEPTIREEAELLRSIYQRQHDVETLLADHVLLRLRNVIITPHSAFNTREAVGRILDTTVANIAAFVRGEPRNVVVG
jgi:D-lactate dehydrogenase